MISLVRQLDLCEVYAIVDNQTKLKGFEMEYFKRKVIVSGIGNCYFHKWADTKTEYETYTKAIVENATTGAINLVLPEEVTFTDWVDEGFRVRDIMIAQIDIHINKCPINFSDSNMLDRESLNIDELVEWVRKLKEKWAFYKNQI